MDKKRAVLLALNPQSKEEILKQLKEDFIKEDEAEPFLNRLYVDETIRLFDMLIEGYDELAEYPTDKAINDIVIDIFRYYDEDGW